MVGGDGGSLGADAEKRSGLWAGGAAVSDHQRAILNAGCGGGEDDGDLTASSCGNASAAVIGLAKPGAGADRVNAEGSAGGDGDRQRKAGSVDCLRAKGEARRRESDNWWRA